MIRLGTIMTSIAGYLRGSPSRGYVYVSEEQPGPLSRSEAGHLVRIAGDRPPWFVVYKTLADVGAHPWPGALWSVEVTEPTSAHDLARLKAFSLRPDAGYLRAAAITLLEQVPLASLFGTHGARVSAVIDVARKLTLERAKKLADARHPQAGQAYTRVWLSWLARERPDFLQANSERRELRSVAPYSKFPAVTRSAELDGTLGVGVHAQSPVGQGLGIVSSQATRRAEALVGKSIWSDDPDDPEGALLAEPWSLAIHTLLDAALASGAPEYVAEPDRAVLLKAWREVIGSDPA